MKKTIVAIFVFCPFLMFGQSNVSAPSSFNIRKEVKPAILNYVKGSLQFVDATGNNAIDANEACKIRFQLTNNGTGDGIGCVAKISASGASQDLKFANKNLPTIAVGATQTIEIPITSGMNTTDGRVNFTLVVEEPNGFGTDALELTVNTRKFVSPYLQIVDHTVTGAGAGTLSKRMPFDLQLLLQNTQYGTAENVIVRLKVPESVYLIGGEEISSLGSLNAGAKKSLDYQLIVNQNYTSDEIPIQVKLSEKYGKYAEDKTITLKLNQTLASHKIEIDAKEEQRNEIQLASLTSAVDKNIPQNPSVNSKTFVVVVANENYQRVADVPYALNDGEIFSRYCQNTFGVPAKNIRFLRNATLNNMKAEIDWLKQVMLAYRGEARVIFYYAGHGIPDDASKAAYLLPVDGYGTNVDTGYKLDDLYNALGENPCKSVTVFLDACFSGAKREGGMLVSARGVAVKAKSGEPQGNMVVFSAATGEQTAYPNNDEKHGMFTYYLLKKLQETKGDVTLNDLGEYLKTQVGQQSIVVNGKPQTPTVTPSSAIGNVWETWKLK